MQRSVTEISHYPVLQKVQSRVIIWSSHSILKYRGGQRRFTVVICKTQFSLFLNDYLFIVLFICVTTVSLLLPSPGYLFLLKRIENFNLRIENTGSYKNLYINVHSSINNSKKWKQPNVHQLMNGWINKMWYIHTIEYHSARKLKYWCKLQHRWTLKTLC